MTMVTIDEEANNLTKIWIGRLWIRGQLFWDDCIWYHRNTMRIQRCPQDRVLFAAVRKLSQPGIRDANNVVNVGEGKL